MAYDSQKLLTPGDLLDEKGQLAQCGYSTSLVRRYDRKAIKACGLRIKEWDYYCITGKECVLCLTIADNSYMKLDSVTLLFPDRCTQIQKSMMGLLPLGKVKLPATSAVGDVKVEGKGYTLAFTNDGTKRVLDVHIEDFNAGRPLTTHVELTDEPKDSMVIATPFAGYPRHFYYNQKINCLRAKGDVAFGGEIYTFRPETDLAVLDWGRGVWTYANTWYWGSLSTVLPDGRTLGLNLGYGFGDTTAATENMLFVDGVAHKLEHVLFEIPKNTSGSDDFMKPWRIRDNNGRLDLRFEPAIDRADCTSVLVIESDQHQVFGYMTGKVVTDEGEEIQIERALGFAEKVKNRW